jgi:glycerol-3-phosphate cytidylyltransferase|tara:strand:+ start:960 stop:1367 length:408 start_codon:yes stop_codon:yes gene_type:complete
MKKILNGFVAGNFDVIHPGYIRMFKECYDNCDHFTVLLHSDPSIERPEKLKPILSIDERIEQLLSIRYIDEVLVYGLESDLYELIDSGGFDVRFLGDDYIGKNFTGDDLGVSLHFINRDHGWSTTKFKKIISETL